MQVLPTISNRSAKVIPFCEKVNVLCVFFNIFKRVFKIDVCVHANRTIKYTSSIRSLQS